MMCCVSFVRSIKIDVFTKIRVDCLNMVTHGIPQDPWDCFIYLHENHKNQLNVGKYTIHGW